MTKFISVLFITEMDNLSSNPYPSTSVIPVFVAYLLKDNTLNYLCGKTLGILSLSQKKVITCREICF